MLLPVTISVCGGYIVTHSNIFEIYSIHCFAIIFFHFFTFLQIIYNFFLNFIHLCFHVRLCCDGFISFVASVVATLVEQSN